jgi:phosphotriesterase-related protein
MIRTVLGDIEVPVGPILGHEHLQIDLSHNKGNDTVLAEVDKQDIITDLKQTVADYGVKAVADLSVHGFGRNHEVLREISQKTGVSVICATGFYWDPMPDMVSEASLETLRDIMINEIEKGIGESGIRCGVIKIGTDKNEIDATVEKLFLAAVAAAKATGAPIITHTSLPEQASWHLDVMDGAGMDLSRVLISHMHQVKEFADMLAVGRRGAFIGIDQLGFKKGPSLERITDLVVQAIEHGLGKQLILSSDIARKSRLRANGGNGYATTFTEFLPLLRSRNISSSQIDSIMSDNPRSILTIRS